MKLWISLLRNSVFNLGENPYIAEYKKVRHAINERQKKVTAIEILNSELSNTFNKNFL